MARNAVTLEDLGKALAVARKANGMSQRDLAAAAGITQAQISKIERGMVDLRMSSVVALSRCLGLEAVMVPRKVVGTVRWLIKPGSADGPMKPAYTLDDEDE